MRLFCKFVIHAIQIIQTILAYSGSILSQYWTKVSYYWTVRLSNCLTIAIHPTMPWISFIRVKCYLQFKQSNTFFVNLHIFPLSNWCWMNSLRTLWDKNVLLYLSYLHLLQFYKANNQTCRKAGLEEGGLS